MEIVHCDAHLAEKFADEIAELVWATGPSSYDYHFGRRELFDSLVRRSWLAPETLFAWDAARLAVEGDQLLGIEIGFDGPEFRRRQSALAPLWPQMIRAAEVDEAEIEGVLARSERASWLNPVVRPRTQYVHALSVKPEQRGRQIGAALLEHAMQLGRERSCKELQLDVLSDNPAVRFYESRGLRLLVESRAPEPESHGVAPEYRMGIPL